MTTTRRGGAAVAAAGPAQTAASVQTPASARTRRAASKGQAAEPEPAEADCDVMIVDAPTTGTKGGKRGRAAAPASKQQPPEPTEVAEAQQQAQPAKRPRGRPRKSVAAEQAAALPSAPAQTPGATGTKHEDAEEPAAKRARKGARTPKPSVAAAAAVVLAGAQEVLRLTSPKRSPLGAGHVPQPLAGATSEAAAKGTTDTAPSTAADAAAGGGVADASHQLQPHDSGNASTAAAAAAATMPATVSPVLACSPSRAAARPLLASQLLRSPPASPRRPLLATAAAAAAAAAAKAASPKPASPKPALFATATATAAAAPAAAALASAPVAAPADAPTAAPAAAVPAAASTAATAGMSLEQTIAQVRRLLQTGALAGTLLASAAAAGAAAEAVTGTSASGSGGGASSSTGAEPAGRAVQFKELCGLVNECCTSGRGSAVYISGLPGTGKTYTVTRLLAALPTLGGGAASFCAATVNCMALDDPVALYNRLNDELSRAAAGGGGSGSEPGSVLTSSAPTPSGGGAAADSAAAYEALVSSLTRLSVVRPGAGGAGGKNAGKGKGAKAGTKRGRSSKAVEEVEEGAGPGGGSRRRVFVVVLDEVDRLLRRRDGGEDLARLFQLPSAPGVSLVLLAVANSLDLTERMMPLLRSRGLAPRHMVFTAYSRPQVLAILQAQLGAHPSGRRLFEDGALDMVAKSVSSSSGDLRQALKACRTALDVLVDHNRANPANPRASVGIRELHAALQRISSGSGASAVVAKIKGLPPQQQLVLLALATAVGARAAAESGGAAAVVIPGPGGPGAGGAAAGSGFQPGGAVFTGSRAKFMDAVAFREIGNQQPSGPGAANPGACFGEAPPQPAGPTPTKGGKGGASGAGGATPSTAGGRSVRGVTGPGAGATPPSRTPASRSILAGDAGLALAMPDVYVAYAAMCRQLDIPAMSESALRTDALPGLECDGLLKVQEGRTPAATRLTLRAMVKDVQAALADNVMFKRLLGSKAPQPQPPSSGAAVAAGGVAVRA